MMHRSASNWVSEWVHESCIRDLMVHRGLKLPVASGFSESMDSASLVVYFSVPFLGMSHPASLVCLKLKVCLNRQSLLVAPLRGNLETLCICSFGLGQFCVVIIHMIQCVIIHLVHACPWPLRTWLSLTASPLHFLYPTIYKAWADIGVNHWTVTKILASLVRERDKVPKSG